MTSIELFRNLLNAFQFAPITGSRGRFGGHNSKYGESDTLMLVSISENGYLLHLDRKEVSYIDWFYGDVTCALLSEDSKWCVMGGFDLFIIWEKGVVSEIKIKGAFDVRQTDTDKVHILIDPWYEDSAIWELNITTHDLKMVRPFTDYIYKEYTDDVIW